MAGNFRETLISWGAKILLGLLIISFGLWGIGDYTSGGNNSNQVVAEVGTQEVTVSELKVRVQDAMNRMRQLLGQELTNEQLLSMGIVDQTLNEMIQEELLLEGARTEGLIINDQLLQAKVREDEQFKSTGGQFSRELFSQLINRAGYNEASFLKLYRSELLQKQLLSAFDSKGLAPDFLVKTISRYRNERRVAKLIQINHNRFGKITPPNQTLLQEYYEDNPDKYTAPEYRSLTLLLLQPKDIADELEVTEEKIKDEYANRIAEFSKDEQRIIQQILVSNKIKAEQVISALNSGGDFVKVASDIANLDPKTLDLGALTRKQVPIEQLAEVAFLLPVNRHSEPIKTDLGWHIIRIKDVIPASKEPLATIRNKLKRAIQLDLAADALVSIVNKLEDELGGGASIDEAAGRLNLKSQKILGIDSAGLDKQGKPVVPISNQKDILRAAFQTPEGQDSALTDYDGSSYFILHVNKVTPPSLQSFSAVQDSVMTSWKREQQSKNAESLAKELIVQINNGGPPSKIAQKMGLDLHTTASFTRNGIGLKRALPGDLISKIFSSEKGKAVWAGNEESHTVAFVSMVDQATITNYEDTNQKIRSQLNASIGNDLKNQLADAFRIRLGVVINREVIKKNFFDSGA